MDEQQLDGLARRIVAAIVTDMQLRRGFRQDWDAIDDDIRGEILESWRRLVMLEIG